MMRCTFAQVPGWYTSHNDAQYPLSDFIIGVGSGNGEHGIDNAKKAALSDIVSQMRVQVKSEVKNVTESYQMNNDEKIYSDFKSQSRTVVSDEITGAEIVETAVDQATQTSFALAVLNRDSYCLSIGSELTSGWKQASDLRNSGKDYLSKGRLVEAIESIQQVRQVISPLIAKQVLYNAVAKSPFQSDLMFNPNVLQEDIRDFLSQVKIEKMAGDNQQGKIGTSFSQPFSVVVSVMNGNQTLSCAGAQVEFVYNGRVSLGLGTTDARGVASITTTIRPVTPEGIRARLSIPDLGRDFEKNIDASSVGFTWVALPSDKKFSLMVNSNNSGFAASVKAKFADAISNAGYSVAPSAPYTLSIDVENEPPGKVEGFSGTMFTVKINVTATITETKSNTILGSTAFESQGVGNSEGEAIGKAVANLQIGENEINDLLQK